VRDRAVEAEVGTRWSVGAFSLQMKTARTARVRGRVQGVFFRAWTMEKAADLGLCGWVRNCTDGSVEVHLEGEEQEASKLIDLLHVGPPTAHVASVEVSETHVIHMRCFEVRH
jgi:acylphosphatase